MQEIEQLEKEFEKEFLVERTNKRAKAFEALSDTERKIVEKYGEWKDDTHLTLNIPDHSYIVGAIYNGDTFHWTSLFDSTTYGEMSSLKEALYRSNEKNK